MKERKVLIFITIISYKFYHDNTDIRDSNVSNDDDSNKYKKYPNIQGMLQTAKVKLLIPWWLSACETIYA